MNTKIFKKAYDDLMMLIESEKTIKRAKLVPFEAFEIYDIMKQINDGQKYNTTISQKVADWFTKHKFNVTPEGIGWIINL